MHRVAQVVIADDHPIFRRGLCDVIMSTPDLRLAGQATDGEELLALIATVQPDVAILDIHMPKLSGLQVSRKLIENRTRAKLVLLTMLEEEDFLNEAMALGIHAYVLKENAVEDLVRAVRMALDGKRFVSASLTGVLLRRRERNRDIQREQDGLNCLTPAERRIIRLIANDKTSKEIADLLNCAVRTVDTHRESMSQKLGLRGSHSLLKFAYDNKARLSE